MRTPLPDRRPSATKSASDEWADETIQRLAEGVKFDGDKPRYDLIAYEARQTGTDDRQGWQA